jgi:hypothetical protein
MPTKRPPPELTEKDYKQLQIAFLDLLLDLDYIDDDKGRKRNTQYLFNRVKPKTITREEFREKVIRPLDQYNLNYVSQFRDYRYQNWGVSFELTSDGRDYIKRQEVKLSNEQYEHYARKILRPILSKPKESYTLDRLVNELGGHVRIVDETLTHLLMQFILNLNDSGRYILTGQAYVTYIDTKAKTSGLEEISEESREKLESLLASLDNEDEDDDDE